jgi:hypothetical protein
MQERFGFGSSELARRLALRSRIEELLRPAPRRNAANGSNTRLSHRAPAPMALRPSRDAGASDFALRQDKPVTPSVEAPQAPPNRLCPAETLWDQVGGVSRAS